MPDIIIFTDHGTQIARHKGKLTAMDLADTPMESDYAEIETSGGHTVEYHGRIVVQVFTSKNEQEP